METLGDRRDEWVVPFRQASGLISHGSQDISFRQAFSFHLTCSLDVVLCFFGNGAIAAGSLIVMPPDLFFGGAGAGERVDAMLGVEDAPGEEVRQHPQSPGVGPLFLERARMHSAGRVKQTRRE